MLGPLFLGGNVPENMVRIKNSKVLLVIVVTVVPLFCLATAVAGVFIGFGITSAVTADNGPTLEGAAVEAEIIRIATEYTETGDLQAARTHLAALNLPNADQYISFMVDRYIQEGRTPNDAETRSLYILADALGAGSSTMQVALATPTSAPTPTLPPTATTASTDTPVPVDTPIPTDTSVPADTPVPNDAPIPTDTPEPPTATLGPPTNTPEPTATPEPTQPAVDFVITEAYLKPNPAYNSCPGEHQIFVTIVDANGSPLDGVTVEDTFRAVPPHISGEKGPGKLEYDLWNNGFALEITKKQDGSPAKSEVTPKMSSWDEDIPNEWLIEANYCRDMQDCLQRKSSNQLCRGHYAYNVTFKRTY